ncbi:hypothetical protein [Streptacidiphilus sp. EB129]|uniref:hypothetical protein n=1 Tax=Streptacidiphilus sp. EB129 TaxID=3156262 RepID=UPI0035173122
MLLGGAEGGMYLDGVTDGVLLGAAVVGSGGTLLGGAEEGMSVGGVTDGVLLVLGVRGGVVEPQAVRVSAVVTAISTAAGR